MTTATHSDPMLPRLRAVLEDHVGRGYACGMVALVGRGADSQVISVGDKALGRADPMRRDALFRIASMTKPITAAAAMMLIEDGRLDLDEPVDRLLPELGDRRVLKKPSTVRWTTRRPPPARSRSRIC